MRVEFDSVRFLVTQTMTASSKWGVLLGLIGWFIRYPATSGYVRYGVDLPQGFVPSDAEQALVSQGYSLDGDYAPEYGPDPHLRFLYNPVPRSPPEGI